MFDIISTLFWISKFILYFIVSIAHSDSLIFTMVKNNSSVICKWKFAIICILRERGKCILEPYNNTALIKSPLSPYCIEIRALKISNGAYIDALTEELKGLKPLPD